jgi:hypothetical protein
MTRLSPGGCSLPFAAVLLLRASLREAPGHPESASRSGEESSGRDDTFVPFDAPSFERIPSPCGRARSCSHALVLCPSSGFDPPASTPPLGIAAWRFGPWHGGRGSRSVPVVRATPTAFSAEGARACCIPSPDLGFAGFRPDRSWRTPDFSSVRFGAMGLSHRRDTLRRFAPRRQPYPVTRVCSLLTVLSKDPAPKREISTVANPVRRSRGCPLLRVVGRTQRGDERSLGHFLPRSRCEPC